MKIEKLYIAKTDSDFKEWIDVNHYNGYRNNSHFNSSDSVYILTIAKKISDNRDSLIKNPPNQYSYEIDWK